MDLNYLKLLCRHCLLDSRISRDLTRKEFDILTLGSNILIHRLPDNLKNKKKFLSSN
jgi:hypothetical protein